MEENGNIETVSAPLIEKETEKKEKWNLERMKELLYKATDGMDVPEYRRDSPAWLKRNLGVRNREHPQYGYVMELCAEILERGGR